MIGNLFKQFVKKGLYGAIGAGAAWALAHVSAANVSAAIPGGAVLITALAAGAVGVLKRVITWSDVKARG